MFQQIQKLLLVVMLISTSVMASAAESSKEALPNYEDMNFDYGSQGCNDFDDPFESVNRKIFAFNSVLDYFLLRPIAKGYNAVLNDYSRARVTNALNNIRTPLTTVNNTLQLEGHEALVSFWRFAINSTFGLFGTFDVAGQLGVKTPEQTFGSTLARYGVAPGPYLVLPLYGSTGARDMLDVAGADSAMNPFNYFIKKSRKNNISLVKLVSKRGDILPWTDHISKTSADPYVAIRSAYYQNREKDLRYPYDICKNK